MSRQKRGGYAIRYLFLIMLTITLMGAGISLAEKNVRELLGQTEPDRFLTLDRHSKGTVILSFLGQRYTSPTIPGFSGAGGQEPGFGLVARAVSGLQQALKTVTAACREFTAEFRNFFSGWHLERS